MGERERFPVLDGLRWLAAAGVSLYHIVGFFEFNEPLVSRSALGTDLYFVLSGFLHAYAFGPKFDRGLSFRRFMAERAIRIWPLYIFSSAILGGLLLVQQVVGDGPGQSPATLISTYATAFFMLPTPTPISIGGGGEIYPFNGPACVLFFEFFYLTLLFGLTRGRLKGIGLGVVAGLAAAALVAMGLSLGRTDIGFNASQFWPSFIKFAYPFLAGMVVYGLWSRRSPSVAVNGWLLVAGAVAYFALICWPMSGPRLPIFLAMALLGWPLLVFLGASLRPTPRAGRVLTVLGVSAYAFFILHYPIMRGLDFVWTKLSLPQPDRRVWWPPNPDGYTVLTAVFFVAVAVFAYAMHRFYDQPLRRWLSGRLLKS